MAWPQIIIIVWLILGVIVVPANDEVYSLIMRLLRSGLIAALLWWGGFWGS